MLDDLLSRAREQAEQSDPPVRVAALMRVARVQTKLDAGQARITFEQALEDVRRLPRPERDLLLEQARLLAAAVCPELLPEPPAAGNPHARFESGELVRIMLDHGHTDAALTFAMGEHLSFPFGMVGNLIHRLEDQDARLALLRRAVQAWQASRDDAFVWLFEYQWKLLPQPEALQIAREIVRGVLNRPDRETKAGYDEQKLVITSVRENTLFRMWHVLLHLDSPLAASLLAGHEQLAVAVRRFPKGMETMQEEAEEKRKNLSGQTCGGGFIMAGKPKDLPYVRSLMQAAKDGDFEAPMQHAIESYLEETAPENPNAAPKEFWASTGRFRSILYRAGKLLGWDAARYLERIPDRDLRLAAQIELAAALAGLPELTGPQRFRPSRAARLARFDKTALDKPMGNPMRSPTGLSIRCPKCQWRPGQQTRWSCNCRHLWNTFWTGGQCPACHFQWTVTVCHRCGETSRHSDWYLQNET
jgi:hypothetical protein